MKTRRRIFQVILYLFFLFLLFRTVYPLGERTPNIFTRLSALNPLYLMILGKFTGLFIPGLIILSLTFILGRFFCGWVCPMGTTIDIGEKIVGGSDNSTSARKFGWIKYIILVATMFTGIFGLSTGYIFEPMSLSYRFYTFCIFPVVDLFWRAVRQYVPAISGFELSIYPITYRLGLFYFILFLVIIILGRYYRRFWCRNLCPLGALLSIPGRLSLIQKKVSDDCIKCGLCTRKCKMGAIPKDPKEFIASECIYCFDCVKECPVNAISFRIDKPRSMENLLTDIRNFIKGGKPRHPETATGFTRKNLLEALGFGSLAVVMSRVDHNRRFRDPALIRPPAALPENDFNTACIRCGKCMKVCITGGLQPTILEGGIEALMTPRLMPAVGFCQDKCNMCSEICPTGAIQPFEWSDKPHIKMGLAKIDRNHCLAWYRDEYCLVCEEYCPYKAVYWKEIDGRLYPLVDYDKCVGCGTCENKCPVNPVSAIRVFTQGEKRIELKTGEKWSEVNPIESTSESDKFIERPESNLYKNP
ncbi:MAG: 4Fe-4S binding protein [Candidatus Eremiobacteraeota bacterium]|nr:4Fe-4S binding protein [Candidatus Eremiobacteraeota bacterium]